MADFFFDTTAFGDRLFGSRDLKAAVEKLVKAERCFSSRYVFEQFCYTFLRDAVQLHTFIKDKGSVTEGLSVANRLPVTHGQRGRIFAIFIRLFEAVESGERNVDDTLETLERWIEFELVYRFRRGLSIVDETKCCCCEARHRTDDGGLEPDDEGFYFIKRSCTLDKRPPCSIEDFWKERESMLDALRTDEHEGLPKAVTKAAREVDAGKPPRGQRCWAHLSDAVIVCSAQPGTTLVSSNLKDFIPIAEVVGERTACDPFKDVRKA